MAGDADKFVFHLIDALMSGNRKTAITLTEHILYEDPKASFQVIGLLISQFEMMFVGAGTVQNLAYQTQDIDCRDHDG